ncbi:MAG: hypothetical protein ABGW79_12240, partial [Pirellulales bacterium]
NYLKSRSSPAATAGTFLLVVIMFFFLDKFSSSEKNIPETPIASSENTNSLEVKFAGVSSYRTTP